MTAVVLLKQEAASARGTLDKCVTCMQVDGRGAKPPPSPTSGAQHPLGLSHLYPSKPIFQAQEKPSLNVEFLLFFRGQLLPLSPSFPNLTSLIPRWTTCEEERIFTFCYSTRE